MDEFSETPPGAQPSPSQAQKEVGFQLQILIGLSVDQRLNVFRQQTHPLPNIPKQKFTIQELLDSEEKEVHGTTYTICHDRPIDKEKETSSVIAGYQSDNMQPLAFKILNRPKGEAHKDIEVDIKQSASSPYLGVFVHRFEDTQRIIKVYPLANAQLTAYVEQHGPLKPEEAVNVMIQVCDALRSLHQADFLHLDVGNVLVFPDKVALHDFDDALLKSADGLYHAGEPKGFQWVKPPELFDYYPVIDESADTYLASMLLYYLLTKRYPYSVENMNRDDWTRQLHQAHIRGKFEIPNEIPPQVASILQKGICPNPKDRYRSADQMLYDLFAALDSMNGGKF